MELGGLTEKLLTRYRYYIVMRVVNLAFLSKIIY